MKEDNKKKNKTLQIRNSTAEFLIFTSQANENTIEVRVEGETVWLTQKLIAELFGVDIRTVNEHLKNIYADGELVEEAIIRKNRIVQKGKQLKSLDRFVTMYLDYAESQAERGIPMTMEDWTKKLNAFLKFNEKDILENTDKVTAAIAKEFAESEFEKYRIKQDRLFKSDFDKLAESINEDEKN